MKPSGIITSFNIDKHIKKHSKECIFINLKVIEELESYINYSNVISFPKKSKKTMFNTYWGNAYFSKDGDLIKIHVSAKDDNNKLIKNQTFYYWQWLERKGN